jgi:predicted transcriptional regulator
MQTVKAEVISMIQLLPDNSTLDEISYHLYVRSKVERGLKAIDEGRFVSETVAEKRIIEWSKSYGLNQH